ncbi:methyltransferase family protein [Nucisporomicrobium flavum]|uniref:methyltransferase family protein n=1 Tax=Nucisporomicrobium flavum TaxID=2785915 RepID=UPI003C300070
MGPGVLVVSVAAFSAGELVQAFRRRRGAAPVDLRSEVAFRLVFFAAVLMLPLGRALVPGAVIGGGAWLGAVPAWAGMLLRWWSFASLGEYFTVVVRTSAAQPVVDRGPYRVLRHPGYTGLLLTCAGVGLMVGNAVSAAGAFGLVLVALVVRIRIEERALVAALGDRYQRFAAGRARLVPFVW